MLSTPWSRNATRSSPMPVSMFCFGSGPTMSKSSLARTALQLLLHEDQVPDLQQPVLELERHVRPELLGREVGAVAGAAVVEDLRARAAGAGDPHRPVVLLLAEPEDPLGREAGDLAPQVDRLRVVGVDGRVELALLEPPAAVGARLGDQVPGQLDGALLEVVAEGEVAAHLEERAVPGGLADVLDVGGAHALLHAHRARVRRGLLAEEVGLERHHAGVDEQQGGVVEQQRGGRNGGVRTPARVVLEVRDEVAPDLCGVHQPLPSSSLSSVAQLC